MQDRTNALHVELFLTGARIRGTTFEVQDRHRLVDVLTDSDRSFRLEDVEVQIAGAGSRQLPVLNVEKRAIVVAVPRETPQQMQQRSFLTRTVGRVETRAVEAILLAPPFLIEGAFHVPSSIGKLGSRLNANPAVLASFIPVTGARITLPGGTGVDASVLLVNRDHIAGISAADEPRSQSFAA